MANAPMRGPAVRIAFGIGAAGLIVGCGAALLEFQGRPNTLSWLTLALLAAMLVATIGFVARPLEFDSAAVRALFPAYVITAAIAVVTSAGSAAFVVLAPAVAAVLYATSRTQLIVVSALSIVVIATESTHHSGLELAVVVIGYVGGIVFVSSLAWLVVRQIEARARMQQLNDELVTASARIAELSASAERARIANELHDSLGHELTVALMHIRAAEAVFESDRKTVKQSLTTARAATERGLSELRRAVNAMSREQPLSLCDAIAHLATECSTADTVVTFSASGKPRPLPLDVHYALFRVAQEALTNSARHSKAKLVTVELAYAAVDAVKLAVSDDGIGADKLTPGFGISNIRRRIEALRGAIQISRPDHGGFAIEVEVPA